MFFLIFDPIFVYTGIITILYQTYRCSQSLFSADVESGNFSNAHNVKAYLSRWSRSSSIIASLIILVALSFHFARVDGDYFVSVTPTGILIYHVCNKG